MTCACGGSVFLDEKWEGDKAVAVGRCDGCGAEEPIVYGRMAFDMACYGWPYDASVGLEIRDHEGMYRGSVSIFDDSYYLCGSGWEDSVKISHIEFVQLCVSVTGMEILGK